jgi:hypothetical protein
MMKLIVVVLAALLALSFGVHAQQFQRLPPGVACGSGSPPAGMSPGYMDATGNQCVSTGAGAGTVAGAVTVVPSAVPAAGITSVETTALANSLVVKATGGNMYSVYSASLTGGASGFLQLFNGTAAPVDGAVAGCTATPITGCLVDCAPFSGGVAQITNGAMPPSVYSFGIVAVVSSATTCLTKTTGVLTAYIVGKAM